jgi:hypothetical protein
VPQQRERGEAGQVNAMMEDQVGFHATIGDHRAAAQLGQPQGLRYRIIHRDLPCFRFTRPGELRVALSGLAQPLFGVFG